MIHIIINKLKQSLATGERCALPALNHECNRKLQAKVGLICCQLCT